MNKPAALIILFIASVLASAQSRPGTIVGVVQDVKGKPISQANVYAADSNNMKRRITTTTDQSGRFRFAGIQPGTYELRAYKEAEGYPDTFFAFFDVGNEQSSRTARVNSDSTLEDVVLRLGPKYAKLQLRILDANGNSVSGGIWFKTGQEQKRIYGLGVSPNAEILVPPVPFHFEIEKEGYETWKSRLISLRSNQILLVRARLKRSR